MLSDFTGRPLQSKDGDPYMIASSTGRPATENERVYIEQCVRGERLMARFVVGTPLLLLPLVVALGVAEGEPAFITVGVLFCLAAAAGLFWYMRSRLRVEVPGDLRVRAVSGPYRAGAGGTTARIGAQPVVVPDHWSSYLPDGTEVAAEAVAVGDAAYLTATDTGLAVEREVERGLFVLIDQRLTPLRLLTLVGATIGLFIVLGAYLYQTSDGVGWSDVGTPVNLAALATTIVLGTLAARFVLDNLRARRAIHSMYYARAVPHALSVVERRRQRVHAGAAVGALGVVGGALLALLFEVDIVSTAVVVGALCAVFGAAFREPAQ